MGKSKKSEKKKDGEVKEKCDKQETAERKLEEIICKNNDDGQIKYLCKWKGRASLDNTWETKERIESNFQRQLLKYEQKKGKLNKIALKILLLEAMTETMKTIGLADGACANIGFDRGLTPRAIVAIIPGKPPSSQHRFMIKWKGSSVYGIVSSKEAAEKCPELVIEFYERNLVYSN